MSPMPLMTLATGRLCAPSDCMLERMLEAPTSVIPACVVGMSTFNRSFTLSVVRRVLTLAA